ncbi:MAG: 5-formyltetrahydrofolate cyclo-ligase [Pseudomonadota bacterium]|nr:5-formyltetrahydrofolate cyclo-ligase [Pseudomonadota bacterium]
MRQQLRAERRALSPHQQTQAAQGLARVLRGFFRFRKACTVAAYWPADGEIDPWPALQVHPRPRLLLPCLTHPAREGRLLFLPFEPGQPLVPNRFGIPEPRTRGAKPRPLWAVDLVLVPLVGFDRAGGRLGMGGGFYDRTFSAGARRRPYLLGVAHHFQEQDWLPVADWDVPLDAVATDRNLIGVRTGMAR